MKKFVWTLLLAVVALVGCSGENGVDGKDGKDAAEVNVDSLASVLREEITGTLWDTLYAEPYVDTVYQILFDNAFATSWMDSVREALIDSLKQADYDSLYNKLYDSVYYDIYSNTVIKNLKAWVWFTKDDIYGAFANQYPLMYKAYPSEDSIRVPLSMKVRNSCTTDIFSTVPCRWNKIMVKAWIEGFTDTSSVSGTVNAGSEIILGAEFKFHNEALLKLTSPEETLIQIRAYALENDREILFFSESKSTTVHPMQENGTELVGVANRRYWDAVWVTPSMDSIATILEELKEQLPNKSVMAYQLYPGDKSIAESSLRVAAAVFDVLKAKGINYVENDGIGGVGQKINYPIEVLRSKQAVCNEYSFLFASILEAIGLEVAIVSVPGHMFVGWRTEEGSDELAFVETTLLSDSKNTFEYAFESAAKRFNEEVEAGNFDSGESTIVFIKDARRYGISPNDIP